MSIKKLLFLFLLSNCLYSACYFIPPKNFKAANPKNLSKETQIAFIGKGSFLNPSINLTKEKTSASLKEYLMAVKENYNLEKCTFRELGYIDTKAGRAYLLEIDKIAPSLRLMQSVFLKDGTVYILTSCSAREEFVKYQKEFLDAFGSFTLTDDLLDEIKSKEDRTFLEKALLDLKKDKNLNSFEKLLKKYDYLGAYWKILILKKAYESIH